MNCFYYDDEFNVYHTLVDAVKSNRKCWFYYHDDVFRNVDWKIEPAFSLDELYKFRAQQIRDDYSYVVLCYSGGNDSTAMLETFYYNNIHIDEILVVGALSQDPFSGTDINHNGDLYLNAFPTLNRLSFPNTKISIVDYTEWFRDGNINNFSIVKQFGDEWAKHIGAFQSVHHFFWYDLKRLIGNSNGRETAVVFGADKVNIEYDNGKAFFRFSNLSFCDYGQHYHNENYHRVNFYADGEKEAIEIIKKQAHVLNRVTKQCEALGKPVPDRNKVFYNIKNPLVFQSEKTKLTVLSPRDTYILSRRDSEIYKMYAQGMDVLKKHIPLTGKNNVFSKPYQIE